MATVKVWDLPTRLFHWTLVLTIIASFVSIKTGNIEWHFRFGYCTLVLLSFRIIWGFAGNRYAKFSSFKPSFSGALATLKGKASNTLGHNPLGAWSVYAMLLALLFQAVSGMFANDDIMSQGAWARFISNDLSAQITRLHKINEKIIMALVLLHLAAIAYYRFVKKEKLVKAMVTGEKAVSEAPTSPAAIDTPRSRFLALAITGALSLALWLSIK